MPENCQSCAGGQYTGISVFGIYDDTTGCPLITVSGSPAVASINTNIVGGEICVTQCTSPWVTNITEIGGVPIGTTLVGSPAEAGLNVFVLGGDVTLTSNTPTTPIYVDVTNTCLNVCGASFTEAGSPAVSSLNVFSTGGTVCATQCGTWTVESVQSGAWTVSVSGTVAVTQSGTWTVGITGATFTSAGSPAESSLNVFVTGGDVTLTSNTPTTPIYVDVTNTCLNVCGLSFTTSGSPAETFLNTYVYNTVSTPIFVDVTGGNIIVSGTVTVTNSISTPLYVDITNTCLSVCGNTYTTTGSPAETSLNVYITGGMPTPVLELATVICGPNAYTPGSNQDLSLAPDGALIVVPADEQFACSIQYYSYDSGAAFDAQVMTTAFVPLWSIQGNGIGTIVQLLREIQVFTDGSAVLFQLIEGGTLTGAAFAAGPGNTNVDTTASAVTGGTVVWSGYAAAFPRNFDGLMDCLNGKTYTIAGKSFKGCAKAVAQIRWSEQTSICG